MGMKNIIWDLGLIILAINILCTQSRRQSKYSRISNGVDIRIEDFPWIVSVFRNYDFRGAGSILSEYYVLTAAHLLRNYDVYQERGVYIVYGTDKRRYISPDNNKDGTMLRAINWWLHPLYNASNVYDMTGDVAVLKLSDKMQLSSTARKVILTLYEPPANLTARMSGWGAFTDTDERKVELQTIPVKIAPRKHCASWWSSSFTSYMICTYVEPPSGTPRAICVGDSGGPLMAAGGIQIGIASFKSGPCTKDYIPNVYANVAKVQKFIDQYSANTASWTDRLKPRP